MGSWAARRRLAATMPLLLVLAAACSTVPAGSQGDVSGSGTPVTKQYDYAGFTGLRVDNAFIVTATRAETFSVAVTVDDNLVERLRVELKGDTLHVGLDPGWTYSNATLEATVTLPSLTALEVTGGARTDVSGFASGEELDLRASGAGAVNLTDARAGAISVDVSGAARLSGQLQAQEISGQVSGAGQMSFEGTVSREKLETSGAGRLDLGDLTAQDADLQLSGGARGVVRVTGTLDVEASGGAKLDYYGSPTVGRMDVSGGAQVNHAGS